MVSPDEALTNAISGDVTGGQEITNLLSKGLEVDDEGNLCALDRSVLTRFPMVRGSSTTLVDTAG